MKFDLEQRLYQMDVALARDYAASVASSSDSLRELLLRLAAAVEALLAAKEKVDARGGWVYTDGS